MHFRHTLLQGCLIKCENLQTPVILYHSLLFSAITLNDDMIPLIMVSVTTALAVTEIFTAGYIQVSPICDCFNQLQ